MSTVKFELSFSNNNTHNGWVPSNEKRMDAMKEIMEELDELYNKKNSKLRNAGIFVTKIEDTTSRPFLEKDEPSNVVDKVNEEPLIYKRIILVKIDTTGLDGEKALEHAEEVKKKFILTDEEKKQFLVVVLPTYEGDCSDVQLLS